MQNLIKETNLPDRITFESREEIDLKRMSAWESVKKCKAEDNKYSIECNADLVLSKLSNYAETQGIKINNISVDHPGLEDVFFKYTGENLPDMKGSLPEDKNSETEEQKS